MALGIEALFALASILTFNVEHDHLRKTGAGTLSVHDVGIAFEERGEPSHNRSWTWEDIQQLTLERAGWTRSPREFRFQLKTPLPGEQYQALWRAVNATRMTIYTSKKEN